MEEKRNWKAWRKKRKAYFHQCVLWKFYFTGQNLKWWFWTSEVCRDGSLQLFRYVVLPFPSTLWTSQSDEQCLWCDVAFPHNSRTEMNTFPPCTTELSMPSSVVQGGKVFLLCHALCKSSRDWAPRLQEVVAGMWSVGLWTCLSLALLPSDRCFWVHYEVSAHLFLSAVASLIFFHLWLSVHEGTTALLLSYDQSYSQ